MKKTWGPHNAKAAREARRGKISERERLFAQGIAGGLAQSAAVRKAGYGAGMSGAELMTRPQVAAYIRELRDKAVVRLDYSIDNLCARLEHIAFCAIDDRQYAAAVSAVLGIAKMMGHLADRTEIEMHIISKPAREPTKEVSLSPEEWQRQFAPKLIN